MSYETESNVSELHFYALFRDTPFGHVFRICPYTHISYAHIWPNMGIWYMGRWVDDTTCIFTFLLPICSSTHMLICSSASASAFLLCLSSLHVSVFLFQRLPNFKPSMTIQDNLLLNILKGKSLLSINQVQKRLIAIFAAFLNWAY